MAYLALARRWRPRTFAEVIGQDHVVKALSGALRDDRVHHALLFSGTRGVGKTTIARALAKSLNCEQGPTATPCGQCSCCVEIAEGRHVDLIEIDAASRTKVEDTRELLENVQYRPTRGRYKIYLIDEVHMLSRHSFNALLKTLEEPPPHVKFLLATTDPQKLPVTVLSRCLQFHLRSLTAGEISDHLARVLAGEAIAAEPAALAELAAAAKGSLRDALSLTDQAVAFGQGQVSISQVTAMLGTARREGVAQLVRLLVAGDGEGVLAQVDQLAAQAVGFERLLTQLAEAMHRLAMIQFVGGGTGILAEAPWPALAEQLAPELVQLYYRLFLEGRRELPLAPDPRIALEMTLLRALAFTPNRGGGKARIELPELDAPSALADQQAAIEAEAEVMVGRGPAIGFASTRPPRPELPTQSPAPVPTPENQLPVPPPAQPPVASPPAPPVAQREPEPVMAAAAPQPALASNSDTAQVLSALQVLRSQRPEETPKKSERPPAILAASVPPPLAPSPQLPPQAVAPAPAAIRRDPAFDDDLPPWEAGLDDQPPTDADLPGDDNRGNDGGDDLEPISGGGWYPPMADEPELVAVPEPQTVAPAPVTVAASSDLKRSPPATAEQLAAVEPRWLTLAGELGVVGLTMQLALNSELHRHGQGWLLRVAGEHQHLLEPRRLQELGLALASHLGGEGELQAEVGPPLVETPAQRRGRLLAERRQAAALAMTDDPTVQFLQTQCEAELHLDRLTLLD